MRDNSNDLLGEDSNRNIGSRAVDKFSQTIQPIHIKL